MEKDIDKMLIKELGRRRVFLFFSLFILIGLFYPMIEESDKPLHALDEYVLVTISIIILIYLAFTFRKSSLKEVITQNNIITILFIIGLIFKIIAFPIEIGDSADFGNEIPVLILLILSLINRFV